MQSVRRQIGSTVLAALALGFCATATSAPPPKANAQHWLVGANELTLYTYAPDGTSGHSRCSGSCAAVWPPYLAAPGMQTPVGFGRIKRADASLQWSYQGRPLYRYAGDTAPGMAKGDGLNGVWHVAHLD